MTLEFPNSFAHREDLQTRLLLEERLAKHSQGHVEGPQDPQGFFGFLSQELLGLPLQGRSKATNSNLADAILLGGRVKAAQFLIDQ